MSDSQNANVLIENKIKELEQVENRLEQLQAERKQIREDIKTLLLETNQPVLGVNTESTSYKLTVSSQLKIDYDEQKLRESLGERYKTLLEPDLTNARKFFRNNPHLLEPYLLEVGKVSREKVKEGIEAGNFTFDDFRGAFEKKETTTLYIKKSRKPSHDAPVRQESAPY